MNSYKQRSQTKTYFTSRTGLSESAIKLSEHHDFKPGKQSFGIDQNSLNDGFKIIGRIIADIDNIRLQTHQIESELYIDLVARCTENRWSRVLDSFELPEDNLNGELFSKNFEIYVRAEPAEEKKSFIYHIESKEFNKRLDLVYLVRLARGKKEESALVANRSFQVLERKKFRVTLESVGKGFNTKFNSFQELGYPKNALWYIEFQNFEDPPEEAVSIYLNDDIDKLRVLLNESSRANDHLKVAREIMLSSISYDVFCHIMTKFIQTEGDRIKDWTSSENKQSLGAILAKQLEKLFSKRKMDDVIKTFKDKPERFRSELQEISGLSNSLKGVEVL